MISPQMSAWVRVWAWVSGGQGGGGSPFIWAAHWCAEPAAGPAAPGGPASCRGAAGAPRLLRLPSRHRAGGAAGHGGVPLQKKYPPNAPKTPSPRDNNKKRVCWAAVPRAGRCRQRGTPARPCSAGSRRQARPRRAPRAPVSPRARQRGKFARLPPAALLRSRLRPRGRRSERC